MGQSLAVGSLPYLHWLLLCWVIFRREGKTAEAFVVVDARQPIACGLKGATLPRATS